MYNNINKDCPCFPVKISEKRWIDALQRGSVFMRSLYDFGSWSAVERFQTGNQAIKDDIQADISEGIVRRVDPNIGDAFFNSIDPVIRPAMKECMYFDQDRYPYYKVFCMYRLTYLVDQRAFEPPDSRIEKFGDTALIFLHPDLFLDRMFSALHRQFGTDFNFKLDEVHYYPPNYYGDLDEFCKPVRYAWQNEMRMRVALLNKNIVQFDDLGRLRKRLIQSTEPITVDVGDLSDITVQIPVLDLISLKLPSCIKPPAFW